jgi:hypothetical protein
MRVGIFFGCPAQLVVRGDGHSRQTVGRKGSVQQATRAASDLFLEDGEDAPCVPLLSVNHLAFVSRSPGSD